MTDLVKNEKKLFSSLKKGLLNDYVRIEKSYVPNICSNRLNRFYSEKDSFWFARLKITDEKTIYYFGFSNLNEESVKPDLILKFNAKSSLSPIKFIKNKVAILAKLRNNNLNYIKSLTKNFKISRIKNFYFFTLGELESDNLLDKLKLFTLSVDYDINFKDNYLMINDKIDETAQVSPLNLLKNNVRIFNFISYLNNTSLNQEFINSVINYLFVLDANGNYSINNNLLNYIIPVNKYFSLIFNHFRNYQQYLYLEFDEALKLFKVNINEEFTKLENILIANEIKYSFSSEFDELFNEYLRLKENPKVRFHIIPSYGLSDEDISNIYEIIRKDIYAGSITKYDDYDDVIESYFKKYVSDNNSKEIFGYYEEFLASASYKELLDNYPVLKEVDLEDINNKIKKDISIDNLKKSDIDKRFEIYFSKKSIEIQYIKLLSFEFKNYEKYQRFGLNNVEILGILENVSVEIKNWHDDWTIFDKDLKITIENLINQKQREIRTEAHIKFEKLYPNKKAIRDVLNKPILSEKDFIELKDKLFYDMELLRLRSEDINDELIIEYYNYIN